MLPLAKAVAASVAVPKRLAPTPEHVLAYLAGNPLASLDALTRCGGRLRFRLVRDAFAFLRHGWLPSAGLGLAATPSRRSCSRPTSFGSRPASSALSAIMPAFARRDSKSARMISRSRGGIF